MSEDRLSFADIDRMLDKSGAQKEGFTPSPAAAPPGQAQGMPPSPPGGGMLAPAGGAAPMGPPPGGAGGMPMPADPGMMGLPPMGPPPMGPDMGGGLPPDAGVEPPPVPPGYALVKIDDLEGRGKDNGGESDSSGDGGDSGEGGDGDDAAGGDVQQRIDALESSQETTEATLQEVLGLLEQIAQSLAPGGAPDGGAPVGPDGMPMPPGGQGGAEGEEPQQLNFLGGDELVGAPAIPNSAVPENQKGVMSSVKQLMGPVEG